jgi:hypothetical protein
LSPETHARTLRAVQTAPGLLLFGSSTDFIDILGVLNWSCHQIKAGYQAKRAADKINRWKRRTASKGSLDGY